MRSIKKTFVSGGIKGTANPFDSKSLLVYLPGGVALDLKDPGREAEPEISPRDSDDLYFPLFPPQFPLLKRETYIRAHQSLMAEMRRHMRMKDRRGIEKAGKKLHRLRKRYRARFAA